MARDGSLTQAAKVCRSCKIRKRKCNKAIPKCSSCSRRNLSRQYDLETDILDINNNYHNDSQPNNAQSIEYSTILFLDPELFAHGPVELHQTNKYAPPPHILQLLGDTDAKFFTHIHPWMPIISKKRFYEHYLTSPIHSTPEIVLLLLLAIKLITNLPLRNPRTELYHAVKHFHLQVEGSSTLSIQTLQAGVLLALYELGHGIYPAAILGIGACPRYAHAMGKTLSRYSTPMTSHMSKFALLCQAAMLLGQVLQHVSSSLPSNSGNRSENAEVNDDIRIQLDRTLQSILAAALDVDSPDYDQIAFVYRCLSSALLALHAPWLSTSSTNTVRTTRARQVIEQITLRIETNLIEKLCFLGRDPEDLSPWGIFFAYRVCVDRISSSSSPPESESGFWDDWL
ncbi:hypothetical protein UA08_07197 [Talaromyces atroroseus]|uniref:Zn(2)-C6 fungal-type domain-containing protein n=1 Tax=Talaromyces atroroseus TaxID=1441469 RepID=A0A225APZ7_TALAT|nr:hypothetical protein UA08_07197 [Talaromyces atroroseus]OKL57679.1 hypothetical protein UA08_07197 [Talaromyces atroroseus]